MVKVGWLGSGSTNLLNISGDKIRKLLFYFFTVANPRLRN